MTLRAVLAGAAARDSREGAADRGGQRQTPPRIPLLRVHQGSVGDTGEFGRTVYATLNDSRGWPRAGLTFVESGSSKCDMTYILAAAEYMKSFSSLCSSQYSCRVGNQVIINYDRWREPTDSWLKGGGNLANYRTMVINHETGHRLDHRDNETVCQQAGKPAPLMQQQSISLRGCTINEWPLDSELWARW